MIKNKTEFQMEGNLQGERVGMSIDDSALAHIMSVLTDLYSDPELAVIREYSTNAFDAHIESGNPSPIEVTLPTSLAPFLRIRDYGDGLNADDIRNIYSRYGSSTKRDTNDQVGMLGLGCKSALTYTHQFTLVGIKEGIRTQVSVSRDEDGTGSMTILDSSETDDASGVEVIIPTKDSYSVEQTASDFFRFWQPGTVLVNGKEPEPIKGVKIADDILLSKDLDSSYVVMGNVAYPIDDSFAKYENHYYVAFVGIGDVSFTPSREALQMTPATKRTVEAIKQRVIEETPKAIENMIASAKGNHEVIEILNSLGGLVFGMKLNYRGKPVTTTIKADSGKHFVLVKRNSGWRDKGDSYESGINYRTWLDAVWLTGYVAPPKNRVTPTRVAKMKQWAAEKGLEPGYFILCDKKPSTAWVKKSTVFTWAEVDAVKLPKKDPVSPLSGRSAGSYDIYTNKGWETDVSADKITQKTVIYYDRKYYNMPSTDLLPKSFAVVQLSANRVAKFKRNFPHAVTMSEYTKGVVEKWVNGLTKKQKTALLIDLHENAASYKRLDETQIDDPELVAIIKSARYKIDAIKAKYNTFNRLYSHGLRTALGSENWIDPLEKYPLLSSLGSYDTLHVDKNHVYLYVNAVYAASKEG